MPELAKLATFAPVATVVGGFALAGAAMAHTPLCACYDMGEGLVLCEGGFSDGSSAAGVGVRVVAEGGEVVAEGQMNQNSEFEFTMPEGAYTVVFDAGEGHQIEIPHDDIF